MKTHHDVIVIGSGPSGASVAETLVLAGTDVCMLDVGISDTTYANTIPDKSFTKIREYETNQHEYFLGKDLEGIQFEEIKSGAQLTPPRQYATREVDEFAPVISEEFSRVESLAYGGLGSAWGLGAFMLTDKEIDAIGLEPAMLRTAYNVIAKRIGISAAFDDVAPYCLPKAEVDAIHPAAPMEPAIKKLYNAYERKRAALNSRGIYVGRTPLALLTKTLGDRRSTNNNDMDFWTNEGNSAYRPNVAIDTLKKKVNFNYYGGYLVTRYSEESGIVTISAIGLSTKKMTTFTCNKLVLCAGIFGTARIVLRSAPQAGQTLPLVCGAYVYYPCIQPRTFGIGPEEHKVSYSQISLFYDQGKGALDTMTVQFYTYSSLMLHRLAPELPINFGDSLALLRLGVPNLIIAGLHQPGTRSEKRYIELVEDDQSITGDKLVIHYTEDAVEKSAHKQNEGMIRKALRSIGCYPVKRIDPGHGGSIHYGGTLPFDDTGKPFTLSSGGKLSGANNVYIADGSGFHYMPAKGPTLTLMANAHNVATHIISLLNI